jgi:acetyl-CoA C-acetyltransferase
VLSTEGGNRYICHPYTKLMNSIIAVDQAAAVVLTTVGRAKALGLDPERWVYLRGAADAGESWFLSQREVLHESPTLGGRAASALGAERSRPRGDDALRYVQLLSVGGAGRL